ncbi:hypothetical protein CDD82_5821 [Ophiocordyceps australis]|uniref:tRNA (guanine(26)-N(2))-dimethyltransferase n=1 Tax=Ophiocordyceps australis TaxID=1399860 RepID=A0A2C5ZKH1_9HYPO|nr:hypothetical protein CDD82_5821 [Ophiocordyceps australis]
MTDIDSAPELIERHGKQYRLITEGQATILVPSSATQNGGEEQQVFYNPVQQYNRDLSCLAIKAYGEWTLQQRQQQAFQSKVASKQFKRGQKRKRQDGESPLEHESDLKQERNKHEAQLEAAEPDANLPSHSEAHIEAHIEQGPQDSTANTESPKPPSFKILDALSASGLRAMRYAHELSFVTSVVANDLSPSASESIKLNVEYNGLQDVVSVSNDDALALMYRGIADDLSRRDRRGNPGRSHKFDVIDLDPYGTAAPFFDAAIQSIRDDGGLLCITCTDSAVWAGHSYCEKTYAMYGGIPLKGMHSHEAALRLILGAIASSGAKYGLAIEPLLSLSIDFYTKFFVRVRRSPQAVKFLGAKMMLLYSCDQGCGSWETQPLLKSNAVPNKKASGSFYKHVMALSPTCDRFCAHCGFKTHLSGPMYAGYIHSQEFIQRVLEEIPKASPEVYGTLARLEGMLRTTQEEFLREPEPPHGVDPREAEMAALDPHAFFVIPGRVASTVSCATPNDDMFRGALRHLGYQVGRSHCRPGSIKTDAPWSAIWWIMTEWIRQKSPVKTSKFKPGMAGWKILRDAGLLEQEQGGAEAHVQAGVETETPGNCIKDAKTQPKSELRETLLFNDALASLGRQRATQRYVRYQVNPQPYWGPMTKAKGS